MQDRDTASNDARLDEEASQGESLGRGNLAGSRGNQGASEVKTGFDGTNGPRYINLSKTEFFKTQEGEVYGFVDLTNGEMYLDETVISPEHPIHEYTHLWDYKVRQENPELWNRGVELMKATPLWAEIEQSEQYGKSARWARQSEEARTFLIASEVHSRLVGKDGEAILNNIEKKQGSQGIVAKLRNWLNEFWGNLKDTFSKWSQKDLDALDLETFKKMTLRDFVKNADTGSYFTDADFNSFKIQVDTALKAAIDSGKKIVLPENGIGTGKAQLEQRAPRLYNYLTSKLEELRRTGTVKFGEEAKPTNTSRVKKIISGGQTGVDTIGLQVGRELGIETGGIAPKGFARELNVDTEDIASYGLREITDEEQAKHQDATGKKDKWTGRTYLNVSNSDGTVYFHENDRLGLWATNNAAKRFNKPFLLNPTAQELRTWINENNIHTLNVAGDRGSTLSKNEEIANTIREALSMEEEQVQPQQDMTTQQAQPQIVVN